MVLCLFASISGIVGLGVGIFLTIAGFVPAVFYKIENPSMDIIICLKNSWYSLMFSLRPLNGFLQMLLLCVIVFISGLPALLFETLGHNTGFLLSLFIFQPFCIVTGGCVAILYEAIKWKRMNASGGPSQMRERGERRDGNNGDLLGGEDDIGASVAEIIEKDFDVAPSQLV
ncbi:hypothetical protein ADUPG1_008181 [Aduncisulcus paluster]|uniref:Uncharacterized protein n=1 Tax=Aduncisulcus paluster TaxID=2918883 RepID=A0ABQ5KR23_9EUKA|nr:hypothetical protein ADUPG1_008181 [Aduncisulcus paluster]